MEINLDGVKLHYEVFGEGKPLLLLHGWGGCVNSMAPIWQFFQRKYQVYVIDFPGQGNASSEPPVVWGVPEYAMLVKHFMDTLAIQKPHVIAHSFGGRVAIFLAAQFENLFQKIVLVDAAGIKKKASWRNQVKVKLYRVGKALLKLTSRKENYEKKLEQYRKKFSSPDYASLSSDIMRQSFSKIIQLDLSPCLEKVQNQTLLVWGKQDRDTPLEMGNTMAEKMPHARLVVFEKAGHFSYLDEPIQFQIVVDQFLSEDNSMEESS